MNNPSLPPWFVLDEGHDEATQAIAKATAAAVKLASAALKVSTRLAGNTGGADGALESDAGNANRALTLSWLNAYNAPHWMQLFGTQTGPGVTFPSRNETGLPGWNNSQTGGMEKGAVEVFGTSWMRDLMRARELAPEALRPLRTEFGTSTESRRARFNGAVDANHAYTPLPNSHATHDMGMAIDFGNKDFVAEDWQLRPDGESSIAKVVDPGWNLANALAWVQDSSIPNAKQTLPGKAKEINNFQQDMLRDFLSLYWATKEDVTASIQSGSAAQKLTIQNALFRGESGGLISRVLIGDKNKNSYSNVRRVMENLGISTAPSSDHHHHFHAYLAPPRLQAMVSGNGLVAQEFNEPDPSTSEPNAMEINATDAINSIAETEPTSAYMVPMASAGKKQRFEYYASTVDVTQQPGLDAVLTTCGDIEGYGDLIEQREAIEEFLLTKFGAAAKQRFNGNTEMTVLTLKEPQYGYLGWGADLSSEKSFGYRLSEIEKAGREYPWMVNGETDVAEYLVLYGNLRIKVVYHLLLGTTMDYYPRLCVKETLDAPKKKPGAAPQRLLRPRAHSQTPTNLLPTLLHEHAHVLGLARREDLLAFLGGPDALGNFPLPTTEQLHAMAALAAARNQAADGAPSPWPVKAHKDHFHITLRPPKFEAIASAARQPQSAAQASAEEGFAPIATAKDTIYLESCIAVDSTRRNWGSGDISPDSAVSTYLSRLYGPNSTRPESKVSEEVRVRVLQGPAHGVLARQTGRNDSDYSSTWHYRSFEPNRMGPDKVVFEVVDKGKTYVVTSYLAHVPQVETRPTSCFPRLPGGAAT